MNELRGAVISMVFQEPMTALDPLYTIGEQIAETVMRHEGGSATGRDGTRARTAEAGERAVARAAAQAPIRMNCPAACGSAP